MALTFAVTFVLTLGWMQSPSHFAADVIAGIKSVSADVSTVAQQIHFNLPAPLIDDPIDFVDDGNRGDIIPQALSLITISLSEGDARLRSMSHGPLSDEDAKFVVKALATLVQVQKELLSAVIPEQELPSHTPYFKCIRQCLVTLKQAVIIFAKDVTVLIPTEKSSVDKLFDSLSVKFENVINVFW
ncbi:unnamed protein product [Calypogeia fissa]